MKFIILIKHRQMNSNLIIDIIKKLGGKAACQDEKLRADLIEELAADVLAEVHRQSLSDASCEDLEKHAYSVNDHIADGNLRNLHVLAAV